MQTLEDKREHINYLIRMENDDMYPSDRENNNHIDRILNALCSIEWSDIVVSNQDEDVKQAIHDCQMILEELKLNRIAKSLKLNT